MNPTSSALKKKKKKKEKEKEKEKEKKKMKMRRVGLFVIVIKMFSSKNVVRSTAGSPIRTCCLLVTVSFFLSIVSLSCFRNFFCTNSKRKAIILMAIF